MQTVRIDLYKATDSEESYGIKTAGSNVMRAHAGFGQTWEKVWSVDIESLYSPENLDVDWDAVLARVIEAHSMSDPVLSGFRWPQQETA
ncbi:MAG TPA: hypothetical protein VEH27_17620 [Methylomirabilota bacterium]|nr:hypothetical protein [Methylomirabilota bacterium]